MNNTTGAPNALNPEQLALAKLLQTIGTFVDDKERDVNGGDFLEAVTETYWDVIKKDLPQSNATIQARVIYAASEEGFWSNDFGWGELESATHFFGTEVSAENMPMSSGNDAKLLTLAECERLRAENESDGNDSPKS